MIVDQLKDLITTLRTLRKKIVDSQSKQDINKHQFNRKYTYLLH